MKIFYARFIRSKKIFEELCGEIQCGWKLGMILIMNSCQVSYKLAHDLSTYHQTACIILIVPTFWSPTNYFTRKIDFKISLQLEGEDVDKDDEKEMENEEDEDERAEGDGSPRKPIQINGNDSAQLDYDNRVKVGIIIRIIHH